MFRGSNIFLNNWNESKLNEWNKSSNWRASLVPAAAVIPAPRVYIKVVAIKTLVVHIKGWKALTFLRTMFSILNFYSLNIVFKYMIKENYKYYFE